MRWFIPLLALTLSGPAVAGDHIKLDAPVSPTSEVQTPPPDGISYGRRTLEGAAQLNLNPAFVHYVREGLEHLFHRRYRQARAHFSEMEQVFPNTAIGSVADVFIWQAVMLENYDFRFVDQYLAASAAARTKLGVAQKIPGNDAWERFMLAGVSGVEAIHHARQGRYLPALNLAFEAIDHVEAARRAAPSFVDIALADGMYAYWRSVITSKSRMLPDFGDHREEGLEKMKQVEANGIFLASPATLSLAYSWQEERRHDLALKACLRNKERYPNSIINEMMLGFTYLRMNKTSDALSAFENVLKIDPRNRRAHYYVGLVQYRKGMMDAAHDSFKTYLAFSDLENHQAAHAQYRLGLVLRSQGDAAGAEAAFREAVRADGHKEARAELAQARRSR